MNSVFSAFNSFVAPGHGIAVSTSTVEEARKRLTDSGAIRGQEQAMGVLLQWLANMAKDSKKKMLGSLCLAGCQVEEAQNLLGIITFTIWGDVSTHVFNMSEFDTAESCDTFVAGLQGVHNKLVIIFQNIYYAHSSVVTIVNHLIQFRKVAKYRGSIPYQFNCFVEKLDYSKVIFVSTHAPPVFASFKQTAGQIVAKTRKVINSQFYDAIVPFVMADLSDGDHLPSDRGYSYAPSAQRFPRLSKRTESGQDNAEAEGSKKQKIVPSTIAITNTSSNNSTTTADSNNTTTSTTTDSNNTTTADSNNTANTDSSPINGDDNNATNNSNNTTTSHPVTVDNNGAQNLSTKADLKESKERENEDDQPFPSRINTYVEPLVDGEQYFTRLYDVFTKAEHEILICGWQLSDVYMLRPASTNPNSKLFHVLQDAARRNVEIYVLLRNYDGYVMKNDHNTVKTVLEASPNIKVTLQWVPILRKGLISSHHQKFVVVDRKIGFVGGLDLTFGRWDNDNHAIVDPLGDWFPEEDYYHCGDVNAHHLTHPRMGWHDVQISVEGSKIVDDLRCAFAQRWNKNNPSKIILPTWWMVSIPRERAVPQCKVQIVRSIPSGSIGIKKYKEANILGAYCDLVKNAKSFVYIENQYFIEERKRPLMTAIINRILEANRKLEPFIIAVILPILPDNGAIDTATVRAILSKQRETMTWLKEQLASHKVSFGQYIRFYGLMQHGKLNGRLVAAQVYVHSKIMITDNSALVGSCNINYRSTSGNRDSEIAAVVHSPEFSKRLVTQLLAEHVGQPCMGDIRGFICRTLDAQATYNLSKYRAVFPMLEAQSTKEFIDSPPDNGKDVNEELSSVKGHIVTLSWDFLIKSTQPSVYDWVNVFRFLSK